MADQKGSSLNLRGTPDRANDYLYVWNGSSPYRSTVNNELGITGTPVGTTDSQTLTNKTLTSPTISGPTLSGTVTGTYTLGGTPTFPASVVTLTGSQTLTNKTLTSPTINSPTITNASLTQDAVTGFTTANSGTVYGISVTSSKIPGGNIANSSVTANQLATGATGATVAAPETTTSTSYTDLATTTDSVTVTIGVNGIALVNIHSLMQNNTANSQAWMSFAISGATTVAASDTFAIENQSATVNAQGTQSGVFLITGLATGSTTFKAKYRASANTAQFQYRRIAVVPL